MPERVGLWAVACFVSVPNRLISFFMGIVSINIVNCPAIGYSRCCVALIFVSSNSLNEFIIKENMFSKDIEFLLSVG